MGKRRRAAPSAVRLRAEDIPVIKGMLARGDRVHDVAAYFGVNSGRISEVSGAARWRLVAPQTDSLPPPGPYRAPRDYLCELDRLRTHLTNLTRSLETMRQTVG